MLRSDLGMLGKNGVLGVLSYDRWTRVSHQLMEWACGEDLRFFEFKTTEIQRCMVPSQEWDWAPTCKTVIRAGFREGDEDRNFSVFRAQRFTEWLGPLH